MIKPKRTPPPKKRDMKIMVVDILGRTERTVVRKGVLGFIKTYFPTLLVVTKPFNDSFSYTIVLCDFLNLYFISTMKIFHML